jgi:hypothetical protein
MAVKSVDQMSRDEIRESLDLLREAVTAMRVDSDRRWRAVADWLVVGTNPYACVALDPMISVARAYLNRCTCTIDPDGARNPDGCVLHDLPPCGFLVDEVGR